MATRLNQIKADLATLERVYNARYPEGDAETERQEVMGAIQRLRSNALELDDLIVAFTGEGLPKPPSGSDRPPIHSLADAMSALRASDQDNDRLIRELRTARAQLAKCLRDGGTD